MLEMLEMLRMSKMIFNLWETLGDFIPSPSEKRSTWSPYTIAFYDFLVRN